MSRESALFYAWAIPVGVIGSVIGVLLGWGETAVFVAGMGPVAIVMLVFMLRERRDESLDQRVKPPAGRRA